AMSEERIITAATVTTGEKNDGKELETLIEKSKEAGMEVNTVIGDAAYSEKGNIEYTNKNEVELVAKLNPITQGTRTKEDELECMSVRLVIWLYGKLVRERKTSAKTKKIHIILTLKNAKFVHLERAVIQLEPKAKPTLLL